MIHGFLCFVCSRVQHSCVDVVNIIHIQFFQFAYISRYQFQKHMMFHMPIFCPCGLCPAKLSACQIQTFLFGHCGGSHCETLLPGRGITVIKLRSINRQTCGMHNKTRLMLLMEEILHHLRCTKLFQTPVNNGFSSTNLNWCRISSINS